MKSKKEALDDAINATKAAVAEGIVPGGGLALLRCVGAVTEEECKCEGDEKTGVQILKRALEAPTRQIAENSAVDAGVVVARMLSGSGNEGFDASRKCSTGVVPHMNQSASLSPATVSTGPKFAPNACVAVIRHENLPAGRGKGRRCFPQTFAFAAPAMAVLGRTGARASFAARA
jgi:hypothetical protein